MGFYPQENKFKPLDAIADKHLLASNQEGVITLHIGEEVELKGILFTVADIAPGQIKLKPKRLAKGQANEVSGSI